MGVGGAGGEWCDRPGQQSQMGSNKKNLENFKLLSQIRGTVMTRDFFFLSPRSMLGTAILITGSGCQNV